MILQSFIYPMGVVLAITLFGASVISQRPAFAQSGARTTTSPSAPPDTSKPSFDTASHLSLSVTSEG